MTFRPNSAAIGGTSSTPPVEEYRRIARVIVDSFFRSARIFSDAWDVVDVGMRGSIERRIGNARQDAPEIGRLLLLLQQPPKRGVSGGHEQQERRRRRASRLNHTGPALRQGSEPVP